MRGGRRTESILVAALAVEVAVFGASAPNFLTVRNAFEIARLGVELGLLAIALTPIVVTGGIDLSVGALLGLSAVVLGASFRDWHVPLGAAVILALAVGALGGALNALLIAYWERALQGAIILAAVAADAVRAARRAPVATPRAAAQV